MPIIISSQFKLNAQLPIDDRFVMIDSASRDAMATVQRYFGLVTILLSDGTSWILANALMGGTDNDLTNNANWIPYATGTGSGLPNPIKDNPGGLTGNLSYSYVLRKFYDSAEKQSIDYEAGYLQNLLGNIVASWRNPNNNFEISGNDATTSQLRLDVSGITYTSPNNGDLWYENNGILNFNDGARTTNILRPESYDAETDDTVVPGNPIYLKASGHIGLAQADNNLTATVVGLCKVSQSPTFSASYQMLGKLTLSDWTAIIGTTSLTPGAIYYLDDATIGSLTTAAPTSVGSFVTKVGEAISSDTMEIEIEQKIRL